MHIYRESSPDDNVPKKNKGIKVAAWFIGGVLSAGFLAGLSFEGKAIYDEHQANKMSGATGSQMMDEAVHDNSLAWEIYGADIAAFVGSTCLVIVGSAARDTIANNRYRRQPPPGPLRELR